MGAVLAGGLQHVEERLEVVLVVHQRLRDRFADGLEGGEVNQRVYMVFFEKIFYGSGVAEVHLDERKADSEDFAYAFVVGCVTIGHVVCNDHIVAGLVKFDRYVAPDKSGSAGH